MPVIGKNNSPFSGFFGLFVTFLTFFLGSCKTSQQETELQTESTDLSPEQMKEFEDLRAEIEIGRNMAGRLLAFYGASKNRRLVRYINEIGTLIGQYSDHPARRYVFDVIESDEPNAFACPGGYILITSGAISLAETEAELAGIISHEIAHIGYKHMFSALKRFSEEEKKKKEAKSEVFSEVKVRLRPKPEKSETADLLARYLSGTVSGLNILKAAGKGMDLILTEGLEPELEYEADIKGLTYAVNAGYDPTGYIQYLCKVAKLGKENAVDEKQKSGFDCDDLQSQKEKGSILAKTHPPISERIAKLQKYAKRFNWDQTLGAKGARRLIHYKEHSVGINEQNEKTEEMKK